jgi:hypothetical protein
VLTEFKRTIFPFAILRLSLLVAALISIASRPLMAASGTAGSTWNRVLITGGFGSHGPEASTELYDPTTNKFAPPNATAVMNTAHYGATATLLVSGKVLVAGGFGIESPLSSTELYDPATNSFAAADNTPVMNAPRYGATATLMTSGKVLVAGGAGTLSLTEVYDPASNTFDSGSEMAAPRYQPTATLLASGSVLVAGGQDNAGWLSSSELYQPATNSFGASMGTMNAARYGATALLLPSGKVLIAGGYNQVEGWLSSTELYDPSTGSFAAANDTAAMNAPRVYATATLLASGKVLIAGGFNGGGPEASTELYDPASNSFASETPSMKTARYDASATLLTSGKVLIAGGEGAGGYLASTEIYDPATNSFASNAPSMNIARTGSQAVTLRRIGLPKGSVTLSPPSLDFGTVKVGQGSSNQSVTLSNGTTSKVTIRGTSIGRSFSIASTTCSSTLSANQSCEYLISFAPRNTGSINATLKVMDTAGKSALIVTLQGVGTRS